MAEPSMMTPDDQNPFHWAIAALKQFLENQARLSQDAIERERTGLGPPLPGNKPMMQTPPNPLSPDYLPVNPGNMAGGPIMHSGAPQGWQPGLRQSTMVEDRRPRDIDEYMMNMTQALHEGNIMGRDGRRKVLDEYLRGQQRRVFEQEVGVGPSPYTGGGLPSGR